MPPDGYPALQYLQSVRVSKVQDWNLVPKKTLLELALGRPAGVKDVVAVEKRCRMQVNVSAMSRLVRNESPDWAKL